MLKGEIATLDHYYSLGGKTRGQGQHLITPQKELPSLSTYIKKWVFTHAWFDNLGLVNPPECSLSSTNYVKILGQN